MELEFQKKQGPVLIAILVSLLSLGAFLYFTDLLWSPVILFIIPIFLLHPFRKESQFVTRLIILIIVIFVGWLLSDLGAALIPFFISFFLSYLLDPFVGFLQKKGIPRWLSAATILLTTIGGFTLVAIFISPSVFSQLDTALKEVQDTAKSLNNYINSKSFYNLLGSFGIDQASAKNTIEKELIPKIEAVFKGAIIDLTMLFQNVSLIATQLINIILIPVLSFYFLKDFDRLKNFIKSTLSIKNEKMLYDLRRINRIVRIYVSWQITAAFIVATVCSVCFTIFGLPYAIVLGILCGFLNPIPYLGVLLSYIACSVILVFVSPDGLVGNIIVAVSVISVMHFINAYFLEPNIAGRQVGLHPLLLIASLFVFGGLFGFIGLFIAVPCTATLMMFFNDWKESSLRQTDFT